MKKTNKKFMSLITLVVILSTTILTACSAPGLSSAFDEATVKKAAENVVTLLNNQDTEGLRAIFTSQMDAAITDEVFGQIFSALAEGGKFLEIEDMAVYGSTDKSSGEEFAVATVRAVYDMKTFTYTISFDKDMQLAGLYYK